ncbi:unnamed protein product [Thelazia callipaeda]|uniref:Methyltransf_11 domain-containing protein n=1 Tax=Thelazia callipaeda TaxID=103827 RepID=A0A0N5D6T7_THECL|nr:unnamed protein product [Thelazia callipaeda]
MYVSLDQAQKEFQNLIYRVEPKKVAEFLDWVSQSFVVSNSSYESGSTEFDDSGPLSDSDTLMRQIAMDIRNELPVTAELPSEALFLQQAGYDSDTTVHVDAFLYDDEDVDVLVDDGTLSRDYCAQCGSRKILPLTFISHSLSIDQLRYAFTILVPLNKEMKDILVVDVGSRLGAVLYAVYSYGKGLVNAIGIEMNKQFCDLQQKMIEMNGMSNNIKVIHDDVRQQKQVVSSADVVVLNNVFSFFLSTSDQVDCWEFLRKTIRPGAAIISCPDIVTVTNKLVLSFHISDWVEKIETGHLAARYAGVNADLFEDCEKLMLYRVKS